MAGVLCACRQQDIRTATILCPQVTNAACIKIVAGALAKTDGVISKSVKVGNGMATVTYDSMKVAVKNLDFVIAEAGFDADDIPANPKARSELPAECK